MRFTTRKTNKGWHWVLYRDRDHGPEVVCRSSKQYANRGIAASAAKRTAVSLNNQQVFVDDKCVYE